MIAVILLGRTLFEEFICTHMLVIVKTDHGYSIMTVRIDNFSSLLVVLKRRPRLFQECSLLISASKLHFCVIIS